jgi:hypothetical protein
MMSSFDFADFGPSDFFRISDFGFRISTSDLFKNNANG